MIGDAAPADRRPPPPSASRSPGATRAGLSRMVASFEEVVAGFALLVVIFAVSWGVLSRYVSRQPAPWANEVATLAFAWLIFIGAAACFKHGMHPSIDMVVRRLPPGLARAASILTHVLTTGFCALMVWLGIVFSVEAWSDPTPVLRLPMTIVYGPVTLGFALMLVRYVQFGILDRPRPTGAVAP